jgi:hypothetical protein
MAQTPHAFGLYCLFEKGQMESIPSKAKANDWEISGNLIRTVQKPKNHTKEGTIILNTNTTD